jgi:hypothetical protein
MFRQWIKVLSRLCPDVKFIVIKRLPEFNAQSVYWARLNKPKNLRWSTQPRNYKNY